jgi:hypothetical protein
MLLGGSTPAGGDRRSVYNPKRDRARPRRRRQGQDSSASAASASSSNAGEGNAKYEAYVPPVRIRGAVGPAADLLEWLRQEAGYSYHYPHSLSAGQEDGFFIARFRSRKERGLFLTEFGAHVPKAPWKGIPLAFEDVASDNKATAPRSSARAGRDRSRGVSFAAPHSVVEDGASDTKVTAPLSSARLERDRKRDRSGTDASSSRKTAAASAATVSSPSHSPVLKKKAVQVLQGKPTAQHWV